MYRVFITALLHHLQLLKWFDDVEEELESQQDQVYRYYSTSALFAVAIVLL